MDRKFRKILQYGFFLALGIFLVWWSVKDIDRNDKSQIRMALRTARYYLIVPVILILLLTHFLRALRWRLLIESLGYRPSRANAFFAVLIGYLANQAFPRLGEVLKCTILSRNEKIPADKLIGTIILERLIDALTLLLVFFITLAIQPGFYKALTEAFFNTAKTSDEKNIPTYIFVLIIIAIFIFIIAIWMILKKKNFSDLLQLIKKTGRSIWQGISAIQHLKKRGQFLFLTLSLWVLYLGGGYVGFLAFHETQQYGIREAFAVLSAGSIGMIITPGGIGAYALLIQKTMQVYGLQKGLALAFGWVLWLAQTGVILLGGLSSFALLPYFNKSKTTKPSA